MRPELLHGKSPAGAAGGGWRVGRGFLGMGGSVCQMGSGEPGRSRRFAGETETWCGRRERGWIGNVKVARSHIQACVTSLGKFPADLVLLKIAEWGEERGWRTTVGLSCWTVAKPRLPQRWSRWGVVERGRGLGVCGGYSGFNFFLCRAQVCLLRCSLLSSLLLLLLRIHETEQNSYCQQIITERHLAELEELVSGAVRWDGAHLGPDGHKSAFV